MMTAFDINFANNILSSIMNCTLTGVISPFMQPIDPVRDRLKDYNAYVKVPVCLNEMMQRMRNEEYNSIQEFVCDFRLMLFNFYRYFGCDSKMGKCTSKLEAMFEQKLLLLPIDVRVKTSMDAIITDEEIKDTAELGLTRRRFGDRSHNNDIRMVTPIKAIMEEMENHGTVSTLYSDNSEFRNDPMNFLSSRLQRWQDKRRDLKLLVTFDEWFVENTTDYDRTLLSTCSEFVELIQFISLGYYATGLDLLLLDTIKIDHITPEDVEYAILFPCSSSILAAIVSLITTKSRNRLVAVKGPLPEYNRWNNELSDRVSFLYKQWIEKRLCDSPNVFLKKFNVEPVFFKVLGQRKSPMMNRQFHELSVFQRCHVLLAMCNMTLRACDVVHNAIDKSIEWEDHQRIVLARIGDFEYVRFMGIGEFSSYYLYRMRALEMDPDLAQYSPECPAQKPGRKKKEPLINKYRVPTWHAKEVRKSKTNKPKIGVGRKKKKNDIIIQQECESIVMTTPPVTIPEICDDSVIDINEDSANKSLSELETPQVETSRSGPPSVISNEEDDQDTVDNNGPELLPEYNEPEEEEIPEICVPVQGEMQLLARDLSGVNNVIADIKKEMTSVSDDDLQAYKTLMKHLVQIKRFFEDNEAARVAKVNECRLRLRIEVMEMEAREKSTGLLDGCPKLEEEVDDDVEDEEEVMRQEEEEEEEYVDESSSSEEDRRYGRKPVKRKWRERGSKVAADRESPQRKKGRVAVENGAENCAPTLGRGSDTGATDSVKVKRKVFQIYNDFFTDELVPVRVKEDGSLESLPPDSVTEERYTLARKMIDLYKLKYGLVAAAAAAAGPTVNGGRHPGPD